MISAMGKYKGGGARGVGCGILCSMVREGLAYQMTLEQGPEGSEP